MSFRGGKHKKLGGGWITLIVLASIGALIGTIVLIYHLMIKSVEDKYGGEDCQQDSDCPTQQVCGPMGICIRKCAVCPAGGYCGDDKCGGTCPCAKGQNCVNGQCVTPATPPAQMAQGLVGDGCDGKVVNPAIPCTKSPTRVNPPAAGATSRLDGAVPGLATADGCDGKVVNPAIPCTKAVSLSASKSGGKKNRVCTTPCASNEECVNSACQALCQPKCPPLACVSTSVGVSDGCGGTCCGCGTKQSCVNGTCVADASCPTPCGAGMTCVNGSCVSNNQCTTTCPSTQTCVNGVCTDKGCTQACKSNETCVGGQCVCQPNCPTNSCGPNGCGGTCSCATGQTCTNGTCTSCTPNCDFKSCGGADGCGGTCGCTGGQTCQNGKCAADPSPWEGWSTTTQFGSGDPTWGAVDPLEYLPYINDASSNRMGAAPPWIEICTGFGTKQNQVVTVIDSAAGKNSEKACFLVQPINNYPDKISGLTDPRYPAASMCDPTKTQCIDINDPSLAAVDDSGKPYPSYLIVPFEGCGGDCRITAGSNPDCINDCIDSGKAEYGKDNTTGPNCQWNDFLSPKCDAAKVLYNNGNWGWNDTMKNNFLQYSNIISIGPETNYGRNISNAVTQAGEIHANYCSGQNMHLDMAMVNPLWETRGMGNIAQLTANSNIMLRYKRVPCNINGNFDINTPLSKDQACPNNYYNVDLNNLSSCTTSVLMPGDAQWPRSSIADHACCETAGGGGGGGAPGGCGQGQVYQATGGACPCPAGQCFFNTSTSADGGLCGQCSSSVSACDQGTKC